MLRPLAVPTPVAALSGPATMNRSRPASACTSCPMRRRKVTYEWDNPGWVATMQQAAKWNKAGYYGKEPWPAADFAAKERAMKYASHFHNNKPGIEAEMKSITGFDWTAKILAKNYLETGGLIATMIGINKQSTAADACREVPRDGQHRQAVLQPAVLRHRGQALGVGGQGEGGHRPARGRDGREQRLQPERRLAVRQPVQRLLLRPDQGGRLAGDQEAER